MGRNKKTEENYSVFNKPIPGPIPETIAQKTIPETIPPVLPGITLNEYLTNHSQDRSLDGVFSKWFMRQDKSNPRKQVDEWDELIQKFLNETV